jgi:mannose-6-phosphate isomerase-like protein (cupin superfamily)
MGQAHAIYNPSDQPTEWMNICVVGPSGVYDAENFDESFAEVPPTNPERVAIGYLDMSLLRPVKNRMGGKGQIWSRNLYETEPFRTKWGRVSHVVVPGDSSIGLHCHDTTEEGYYILAGRGHYVQEGERAEVGPGDLLVCPPGGSHGIYNAGGDDLEIFATTVCTERGRYDMHPLGDDLTGG